MFDDSVCFLNGTEMRPKVAYLVGSGSVLRLGESEHRSLVSSICSILAFIWKFEFELLNNRRSSWS